MTMLEAGRLYQDALEARRRRCDDPEVCRQFEQARVELVAQWLEQVGLL